MPAVALMVKVTVAKVAAMVGAAVTFVKLKLGTAPTEEPSTSTSAMVCVPSGVMVKPCAAPQFTGTDPAGVMEPPVPAEAVMVKVFTAKLAAMVWLAATALNVKLLMAPCETPSTSTSAIWKQALGTMVKLWLAPQFTTAEPAGVME